MSWQDRFTGQGSYRGAAFLVQESRSTFGRRQEVHEYAGRDVPYAEDRGRAARRWSIECFVVGPDYDVARDALIKAIEAPGAGTLVHPYLGTVQASCSPSEVVDSTANGGMASFSLVFVESGSNVLPAAAADTQAQAVAAATASKAAAATSAAKKLSVLGQVANVANQAKAVVAQAQSAVSKALAAVKPVADDLFEAQQAIQGVVVSGLALINSPRTLISDMFTSAGAIVNLGAFAAANVQELGAIFGTDSSLPAAPAGLAVQVYDAVQAVADAAPVADDVLAQMAILMTFGATLPPVTSTTPSGLAQATNQLLLSQMVECAAAAAAVNTVADMVFTSYQDAANVRDTLAAQIDALALAIADTGDDELAEAMDTLRLAMIADVTARGASLQRLYDYTPSQTEPMVVIAQRLYGDATRADEMLARNPVVHPLFVPGGQPIQVLTDA